MHVAGLSEVQDANSETLIMVNSAVVCVVGQKTDASLVCMSLHFFVMQQRQLAQ